MTWDLTAVSLADGQYTAELPASAATSNLAQTYAFEFHKLAGDVDGNRFVTFGDYDEVNAHFNTSGSPFGPGDADGDGFVNFNDFFEIDSHFNTALATLSVDFGDALDSTTFPTSLGNDGARHAVTGNSLYLGSQRDAETDGQSSVEASGDNLDNTADEDGVAISALEANTTVAVVVTANVPQTAVLNGWIDFNQDGDWDDPGEQVFANEPLSHGINGLSVAVPATATVGTAFARFRVTQTPDYSYFGLAPDGEVEDYKVTITPYVPTVEFSISGDQSVTEDPTDADNNQASYTISYVGVVDSSETVSVDVSHVFDETDSADFDSDLATAVAAAAGSTPSVTFDGTTLSFQSVAATASAGAFAGTASQSTTGGDSWSNITNATGDTSSTFARVDSEGGVKPLRLTGYNLGLPGNATIDGIEVALVTTGSNDPLNGLGLWLTKDGTTKIGTAASSSGSWSGGSVVVGGATDLWSETWTAAEINSANFGIVIQGGVNSSGATFKVYTAEITVSYTAAGSAPASFSFAVPVAVDSPFESDEFFSIQLSNASRTGTTGDAAVLTAAAATTIINDPSTSVPLGGLDGTDGLTLNGVAIGDWSGTSVSSAGDVNGDGFDDVIVGAPEPNGPPGESYVVFGAAGGFTDQIELSSLDGTNGFRLMGIDTVEFSGFSVSAAGDVNGDGFDDVVIGAYGASTGTNTLNGRTYVVFGASEFAGSFDLSTLDGTNGFVLGGVDSQDESGISVSGAGDVNGDGLADIIVGARFPAGQPGEAYVVFGVNGGISPVIDLSSLSGTDGFRLTGIVSPTGLEIPVSGAGDVNGDGFADLIVGAGGAGTTGSGSAHVVFGAAGGFGPSLDISLLNGTDGFRLDGIDPGDWAGTSVSGAGDVNADGFDDLIIGAKFAGPGPQTTSEGEAYVVLGAAIGFGAVFNLSALDGTNGFRLDGINALDTAGFSVSGAGDVDGDGFDDVLVGAPQAGLSGAAGETYVVFGAANGFPAAMSLASLDGTNGFQLDGVDPGDQSGSSVSGAGDVNGDGFDDLIIGAPAAAPGGRTTAGESYVVFGRNITGGVETQVGDATGNTLTAAQGAVATDILIGGGGDDVLVSDGGADVLRGGEGDDVLAIPDADFSSTRRLQGGNGTDTLRLDGSGVTFDLTAIADNRITDIEQIDLRGSGDNTLILDVLEVLNLSTHSNRLLVRADAGGTVDIGTGWTQQVAEIHFSEYFRVFTQGVATLLVEAAATIPDLGNPTVGDVDPDRIDRFLMPGETSDEIVSLTFGSQQAAKADIVFVVDESGSMANEQAWIDDMITGLDAELAAAGITDTQYALVGYVDEINRLIDMDPGTAQRFWGSASEFVAASNLVAQPKGTEDGYDAIDAALNNLTFRQDASKHIILVTDEDRDDTSTFDYPNVVAALGPVSMGGIGATLHSIVNMEIDTLDPTDTASALGIDGKAFDSTAYFPDGSGGVTSDDSEGVNFNRHGGTNSFDYTSNVTTEADYIDLAFALGGTVWDLAQLRVGGVVATSFTNAFVGRLTDQITAAQVDLVASDPSVTIEVLSETLTNTGVTYNVRLTGKETPQVFDLQFVRDVGGTATVLGSIPTTITPYHIRLTEGTDFDTSYEVPFTVPADPQALQIRFSDLVFDGMDANAINDAFEFALVDAAGNPLVGTTGGGRDAFLNSTEGEVTASGGGVSYVAVSGTAVDVFVDITHLAPGTEARLIARLVNNDSDTMTTVAVQAGVKLLAASPVANPSTATPQTPHFPSAEIDFVHITDVTAAVGVTYRQTSFASEQDVLYVDVELKNDGPVALAGPLLLVVDITDPESIGVLGWDGLTPEGLPYYDLSRLLTGGTLGASQILSGAELQFSNPNEVQFDYELRVLSYFNSPPAFQSTPVQEVVAGKSYTYNAVALDPENDTLTYSLVSGPSGMAVDPGTGVVTWTTVATDEGLHQVLLRATETGPDGLFAEQEYQLLVSEGIPNRPPQFTSTPIVDAFVGSTYLYQSQAWDPDGDVLVYAVENGPAGLTIDPSTGLVTWAVTDVTLAGQFLPVTISATETGQSGDTHADTQDYLIAVHSEIGNLDPIIITDPRTTFELPYDPTAGATFGDVDPDSLTFYLDEGDQAAATVSVTLPDLAARATADIIVIVDHSTSMVQEIGWIPDMIAQLDAELQAQGITGNRFALMGFAGFVGDNNTWDQLHIYSALADPLRISIYGPDQQLLKSIWAPDEMRINDTDFVSLLHGFTLPTDGEYLVVVENAVEDYQFHLSTVTGPAPREIQLGTPITVALEPEVPTNVYNFTVPTDGFYRFTNQFWNGSVIPNSPYAQWRLVDASGNTVFEDGLNVSQPFVQLAEGSYDLYLSALDSDAEGNRQYTFVVDEAPYSQSGVDYTLESRVTGTAGGDVTLDTFNFTVLEDALVSLDVLRDHTGDGTTAWTLSDHAGSTVASGLFNAGEPVLALPADKYSLKITDGNGGSGAYDFRLLDLASGGAIIPGGVVSDTLAPARETDVYRLSASTGDHFAFDNQSWAGTANATWRLVDPSGVVVFSDFLNVDQPDVTLTSTGDYTLLLAGDMADPSSAPGYSFTVTPLSGNAIPLGPVVNGTLAAPGATGVYRVILDNDTLLAFDAQTNLADFVWTLADDLGTQLVSQRSFTASDAGGVADADAVLALVAGTYTLTIEGLNSATGDYAFAVIDLAQSQTLTMGTTQTLHDPAVGTQAYSFLGIPGESFSFDVTTYSGPGHWRLVAPSGAVVAGGLISLAPTSVSLTELGQYTLMIEGTVNDAAGDHALAFDASVSWSGSATVLGLDTAASGTISTSAIFDAYTISATAGQQVLADWLETDDDQFTLWLRDPVGNVQVIARKTDEANVSELPLATLPVAGDYTIVVGRESPGSGDYRFRMLDVAAQPAASLNAMNYGFMGEFEADDVFRLTGTAGQQLQLTIERDVWGTAARFPVVAQASLVSDFEDGYYAINHALETLEFRPQAARQIIFLSDEQRDNGLVNFTPTVIADSLADQGVGLHSLTATSFDDAAGRALGTDGLTSSDVVYHVNSTPPMPPNYTSSASGNLALTPGVGNNADTIVDYVNLALDHGGTAWDLTFISSSIGNEKDAFTEALAFEVASETAEAVNTAWNISLVSSDPAVSFEILGGTVVGDTVSFDVRFTGDGTANYFDLQFVRTEYPGIVVGAIPTAIGNGYLYDADAIDPDDDVLTYELVGETHGATIDSETGVLEWLPAGTGLYDFTARVTDGRGGLDVQTWQVNVTNSNASNTPPLFDSHPTALTVAAGRAFEFAFHATDADGDLLFYQLRDNSVPAVPLPAGMLIDRASGLLEWTPTDLQLGPHTIKVLVHDGHGGSDETDLTFTVIQPAGSDEFDNVPPQIISAAPTDATVGFDYSYEVIATDGDNDPLRYSLSLAPAGMAIGRKSGVIRWTPRLGQDGAHDVIVRVTDGRGGVDLEAFTLNVIPNSPPVITSDPSRVATPGVLYSYQIQADDPDVAAPATNEVLTYVLWEGPDGAAVDSATGLLSWTLPSSATGSYEFVVGVSDQAGDRDEQSFFVDTDGNTAPVLEDPFTDSVAAGQQFVRQIIATDADGDPLTYRLDSAPPAGTGFTFDEPTGFIVWSTSVANVNDPSTPYSFTVTVDDGRGGTDQQTYSLHVVSQEVNQPPAITSNGRTLAALNYRYAYAATATDPENDTLFWSLVSGPRGMEIDQFSGLLTWVPDKHQLTTHTVTLQVADAYGGTDTQTFDVSAFGVNLPPQIESLPITQAWVGEEYVYDVSAYDPEGDSLTFELVGSLAGLAAFDEQTGRITWTPPFVGLAFVEIVVSDGNGGSDSQIFDLVVGDPDSANRPPVIETDPDLIAIKGQDYVYEISASDLDMDTLSYQLVSWPPGADIPPGTSTLTWPTASAVVGDLYFFDVAVSDGTVSVHQRFSVVVHAATSPQITASDATVTAGALFTTQLAVSSAEAPLTFTVESGPPAMSFSQNGLLFWQTTTADANTVPYPVTIKVTDALGNTGTASFNLTVVADDSDPVVTIVPEFNPVALGSNLRVHVQAVDDLAVASLTLTVGGAPVFVDASGFATIPVNSLNTLALAATATDAAGHMGTDALNVLVFYPNDAAAPVVSLVAPSASELTKPTDLLGTVDDPDDNLLSWTLTAASIDTGTVYTLSTGSNEILTAATLGTFDTTRVPNGVYVLTLSATDGLHTSTDTATVTVTGNLKLGAFSVSFVDLQVPVVGFPLTITRSYNTLDSNKQGDFGYGWSLDIPNTKVEVQPVNANTTGLFGYTPFVDGTRVVITLPDGTTEGFTFIAKPVFTIPFSSTPQYYLPNFQPDFGVTSELLAGGAELFIEGSTGEYTDGLGNTYNPENYAFGGSYELILRNGTSLVINAETGDLSRIIDLSGNELLFTGTGIVHSAGKSIIFKRDNVDRIIKITGPDGRFLTYQYAPGSDGDLIAVTDLAAPGTTTGLSTTQFTYLNGPGAPDHYLDQIIDPLGRPAARTTYSPDGRLKTVTDNDGSTITYAYDVDNRIQTITDQLGNTSTVAFDARGNIIREVDQTGAIVTRTFDNDDNLLAETTVIGLEDSTENGETDDLTVTHVYNPVGDRIQTIDPRGNLTRTGYNNFGQPISTSDALGNTSRNVFKNNGQLSFTIDPLGNRTSFLYDTRGNLLNVMDDEGNILVTNTYNQWGDVLTTTPATGRKTNFAYDPNGNQVASWQYDDEGSPTKQFLTLTKYDEQDRVISTQQGTLTTFIEIDFVNAVIAQQDLDWQTSTVYNLAGQVESTTDRNGFVTENTYDSRGQLIKTRRQSLGEAGNTVYLTSLTAYDAAGRAIARTAQSGQGTAPAEGTVTLYDDAGRVVETQQVANLQIVITGTAPNLRALLVPVSPGDISSTTSTIYDNAGRVVTTTDSYSLTSTTTYNQFGEVTESRRQAIDESGFTLDLLSRTVYDSYGRVTHSTAQFRDGTTEPITGTQTVYDDRGRAAKTVRLTGIEISIDPATGNSTLTSSGTVVSQTETIYDADGRVSINIDSYGLETRSTYDSLGRTTETRRQSIDENGNTVWLVNRTYYDALGRASVSTDQFLEGTSDPIYGSETLYDEQGRTAQTIRREGLDVAIDPTTGDATLTAVGLALWNTQTIYDQQGRVFQQIAADGQLTEYEYDALGRQVAVIGTPVTVGGQTVRLRSETLYDGQGRAFQQKTNISQDAATGAKDYSNVQTTTHTYDARGNLIKTTYADSSFIEMTYDERGRKLTETNQLGLTRTFSYDAQGRLASVSLPDLDGDPLTTSDIATYTYAYDEFGNQTSLLDPLGRETSWVFDDQGRETSRTLSDGSTESYTYDDRGRRLTHTSFEGVTTTFVYDAQTGRLDQKLFDNSTTTEYWSYQYDAFGREVQATQLTAGLAPRVVDTTYDAQRRVESVSSPEGVVSYESDDFGRTVRMTIGDLSTPSTDTRYTYDVLGRLETVTVVRRNDVDLTTPEVTTYEYNLIGSLSRMTAAGSVVTDYVYDDLNRLTSLTNTDAGGNTLSSYAYQLQADGRRTQSTEQLLVSGTLQTTTFTWSYDRLGRLVTEVYDAPGVSDDWTTTYTFDLTGNRLSKATDDLSDSTIDETITYVYDTNDRLLTESLDTDGLPGAEQTTTYTYDVTQQASKTILSVSSVQSVVLYTYDLQGRMETVIADTIDTDGSTILSRSTTTFDYDTSGIRVFEEHTVDAGNDGTLETHTQTTYLADHRNQTGYAQTVLQLETDVLTSETTRTDTTYGLDEITQTTTDPNGNATTYVFLHDGRGSTRALTNMSSGIVETYTYDAYGNAEGFDPQVALTGLLYNGEYFQVTIGLNYNRARWYDPKTGTWKRLDDFFGNRNDPQSFNKYLYTHGDPVNGIDPTGEFLGTAIGVGVGLFMSGWQAGVIGGAIGLTVDQIGLRVANRLLGNKHPTKYVFIYVNTGVDGYRNRHFDRVAVQQNVQAIVDDAGISMRVAILETQTDVRNLDTGFTNSVESYLYNSGWQNLNPLDVSVNLLHDLIYLPLVRETQSFTHTMEIGPNFGVIATTPNRWQTPTQVNELRLEQLMNRNRDRGQNVNWDNMYSNLIMHEVFYLSLIGGTDNVVNNQDGIAGGSQSSEHLLQLTEKEASDIEDAIGL